ncbi:DNA damage response protein wss1-like, partial [Trifolium pratense]
VGSVVIGAELGREDHGSIPGKCDREGAGTNARTDPRTRLNWCPNNPALLGCNVGAGIEVKLRLRRPNRDSDFIPLDQVLDTMLHELCHNAHGPHNANFYKLWDELRKVRFLS